MPLDPRMILLAGQGVPPPRDPLATVGGVLSLQQAQQQQQLGALQLAEAQRQERERGTLAAAFRGALTTDPTTGQTTVNMPQAFSAAYRTTSDPLTVFKAQQEYGKTQAARAKDLLEAQKLQLEQQSKGLEFAGQVASGVEAQVQAGGDPQQAWQWGIQQMRSAGFPIQGVPPTYDESYLARFKGAALAQKDAIAAQQKVIDQQLRERELAETRRRTDIQQAELGIKREDVTARREEIAERRAERQQQRETQAQSRIFEQENTLRDEFQAQNKNYREVRDAWGRIATTGTGTPTPADDYALIYSFMKMLDPLTGIRDAETRNAVTAGGLPAQTQRWLEWVQGNQILPDTIREQFVATGQRLYNQYTKEYEESRRYYEGLARHYGLTPERVTQELRATVSPHAGVPVGKMTPQQLDEEERWLTEQLQRGK